MPTTETYTYDPTDDAVLVEQAEQRDAETLAIGEKMIADQEQLLAGKYKTTQDLENAYLELQKKQGEQSNLNREADEDNDAEQTEYEFYTEDGSVNYETAEELYGEKIGSLFKDNDIDPFEMNEYFAKNDGTLSKGMYKELANAGLNKTVVDSYLAGVRNEAGLGGGETVPILNEQEVAEVHSIAGGPDGYSNLMQWASDNLSDSDAKNFDEVIETGNKAAVTFAVKALMGQYEDTVGRDSNLLQGKKSTQESYRSMAEVIRDMNNPLYENDESYREDVRRKLQGSSLKL